MRAIICMLLCVSTFACSSNCLECHPKLKALEYNKHNKYYKEHHFLITCTKCHPNHNDNMSKCGADCFECHSRKKLINTPIPEHQRLSTCTKCHGESITDIIPKTPKNENFLNFSK
jgi:hypothetical protein